jgi:hypothetical protein
MIRLDRYGLKLLMGVLGAAMVVSTVCANTAPASGHDPAGTRRSVATVDASPAWAELNERQHKALWPLKKMWPEINQAQKRKWLAVSRNYHDLPEQEQDKMHARMNEWAALGARERAHARLEYARAQTISVDERRNRWEAYQALSEEERKQWADQPVRKLKGAAIALHPVPTSKIVAPPNVLDHATAHGFSALRFDTDQIHPRTLLPLNVPGHASP